MVLAAGLTDKGIQRDGNEDQVLVDARQQLFVLCDGMGGHNAGEVASCLGAETIQAFIRASRAGQVPVLPYPWDGRMDVEGNRLSMAIRWANAAIHAHSRTDARLHEMGTTVAAVMVVERSAYIAHAGDSRVYRWRTGRLEQLTRDHSELNDRIAAGEIQPADAWKHPDKNVITRALGPDPDVQPSMRLEKLRPGDLFLLCSDGLTDLVSDRKLTEMLTLFDEAGVERRDVTGALNVLCSELVKQANRAGGKDNISVMVLLDHG